ncbi:hypothetical protein, partial [Flavobacterium silvaticum]
MRKTFFRLLLLGLFSPGLQAQDATINYTGLGSGCNVFASNTTVAGYVHRTTYGAPTYNSANQSIKLTTSTVSGTKGTEFKIAYNFKVDHLYTIKALVRNTGSSTVASKLYVSFGDNGSSTACSGPQTVTNATGLSLQIANTAFQDDEYHFNTPVTVAQSYIRIAAIPDPGANPATQVLEIKRIVIDEIPPNEAFVMSPNTLSVPCGSTTTTRFTCVNVHNATGISSYQWTVGPGWTDPNGNTVSGNFYTYPPQNYIDLKPNTTAAAPGNIVALPVFGFFGYNGTTTCSVSLAPFNTVTSVSGPTTFCTSSSYTVSGMEPGVTFSGWTVSPPGIVSLSTTSATTTTL